MHFVRFGTTLFMENSLIWNSYHRRLYLLKMLVFRYYELVQLTTTTTTAAAAAAEKNHCTPLSPENYDGEI